MRFSNATISTLLAGVFFNTFLYGIVTYQFAAYFKAIYRSSAPESRDPLAVKCMVLFLFILDTFHSVSVIYMAFDYITTNHNYLATHVVARWPYTFTPVCTALAALVEQMFMGYRIWRFTRNKILCGIVLLLAIPSFALAIACSVETWVATRSSERTRITALVVAWLLTQVTVDVFIAITLITAFSRSRTGFPKTDTVLERLIRCAVQTGLFVVVFCVADLVVFVAFPKTDLYGMFAIPIGCVYTITLLDTLLVRESIGADMADSATITLPAIPRFTTGVENERDEPRSPSGEDVRSLSCEDVGGKDVP